MNNVKGIFSSEAWSECLAAFCLWTIWSKSVRVRLQHAHVMPKSQLIKQLNCFLIIQDFLTSLVLCTHCISSTDPSCRGVQNFKKTKYFKMWICLEQTERTISVSYQASSLSGWVILVITRQISIERAGIKQSASWWHFKSFERTNYN